jgi:hypothetical protein
LLLAKTTFSPSSNAPYQMYFPFRHNSHFRAPLCRPCQ